MELGKRPGRRLRTVPNLTVRSAKTRSAPLEGEAQIEIIESKTIVRDNQDEVKRPWGNPTFAACFGFVGLYPANSRRWRWSLVCGRRRCTFARTAVFGLAGLSMSLLTAALIRPEARKANG